MRSEKEIKEMVEALQQSSEKTIGKLNAENVERVLMQRARFDGAIEYLKWVLDNDMPEDGFWSLKAREYIR